MARQSKPWWRKKMRHYSAERTVRHTRRGTLFRRDAALCWWCHTLGYGGSACLTIGYILYTANAVYYAATRHPPTRTPSIASIPQPM
jgi:hypothetical protein